VTGSAQRAHNTPTAGTPPQIGHPVDTAVIQHQPPDRRKDHGLFTRDALCIHAPAVHNVYVDRAFLIVLAVAGLVAAWTALRGRSAAASAPADRPRVLHVDLADRDRRRRTT
jgi:hypothetical protein